MNFILPKLPFEMNDLSPLISAETLEFHYGRHHKTYVETLNKLIKDTPFAESNIEQIIREAGGALFNNAAQAWNHTFYWNGLQKPQRDQESSQISAELKKSIESSFGSLDAFKKEFSEKAVSVFGSGWAWLVEGPEQEGLEILCTPNADLPQKHGRKPLMNCDVWEHAYYIDYRNERKKYLEAFWPLVNWRKVSENYEGESIDLNAQFSAGPR